MKRVKKQMSNTMIIGNNEQIEKFCYGILMRMKPRIYNEFGCIKIRVIASLLEYTGAILQIFRFAGLKEVERKKKKITTDKGYVLNDAYEITLEKIPILCGKEEDYQ